MSSERWIPAYYQESDLIEVLVSPNQELFGKNKNSKSLIQSLKPESHSD